jgi:putative membrane-bound dehydrogenase-like protein
MTLSLLALLICTAASAGPIGNRLTYLDDSDPFYPSLEFPRLTTPQWVGETNVEAVVILAIDDMRDPARYETFLRPILNRLKEMDGRAPVSIFCNALDPPHPQLASWLKEGLSLEVHTLSHPCPCLAKGDFTAAANTYHGCVDLLHQVPGNIPVAFRMPCCDSMNSPSPRFYAEIFNGTNSRGQFLTIDSSVMNIPTAEDSSLPRELVIDANGRPRFQKYFPSETNATTRVTMKSFVTTIRNYPYPYVVGGACWEFPAAVPSDWEAHNSHGSTNPVTVADWKAALDIVVLKQGVFSFIFHPHGWVRNDQLIEFIDYSIRKHGSKVKFLTFREAQERVDKYLLGGRPPRQANSKSQTRLLDLNNDGFLDVVQADATRLWNPATRTWKDIAGPVLNENSQFGIVDGHVVLLSLSTHGEAWRFINDGWTKDVTLVRGLKPVPFSPGRDQGVRLRDVNNDDNCEVIVANSSQSAIYTWSQERSLWQKLPYSLPTGVSFVDTKGNDFGLRFVDFDGDGYDDIIYSNPEAYGLYLFLPRPKEEWRFEVGWTRKVRAGKRTDDDPLAIPMITRGGTHPNNGVWFHSRQMWIQNEDTAHLPDKVDRRSFEQLLAFDSPAPKSPEESRACMRVRPGFKVELVVAEPLVMDPIAFDWGADGKLWVVEMGDYPAGIDGQGKAGGIIRFLEDSDDDGRYDKSTVFLSGLSFPTGVMPWRKGVIISAAPEVFYAEDRDGDGRADHRVTLLEGFARGNQQHRVNGFEYGLDNWVYGANGDSGGMIRSITRPTMPLNMRGHDFRFRPDDGILELIEGQTQFGRHRDDWGNWFGNNNPSWGWHYWMPERNAARNEHVAFASLRQPLANYRDSTRVFSISKPLQRFNWPNLVNTLTSANSLAPYRDDLFGPDFVSSIFISEPAHNLVHREQLVARGVTFDSQRVDDEKDREFLASTDNWFRPTMLKTGPDGALYIADMYRLVIEHTEYALPGMEKQIDVRAGSDRGRIYRVFPEGARLRKTPRLDRLSQSQLVTALDSPNGWQRDTAQRLLVHGQDKTIGSQLRTLLASAKNPKARLHALCTLEGLSHLTIADLQTGWSDSHPIVRAWAVRLSEGIAGQGDFSPMFALASDQDMRVRFQLGLTLGEPRWPRDAAAQALARIASQGDLDTYMEAALLSSAPGCLELFVEALNAGNGTGQAARRLRERLLALATAVQNEKAMLGLLRPLRSTEGFSLVNAFLETLRRRGTSLSEFGERCNGELRALLKTIPQAASRAETAAFDPTASQPQRIDAIKFLGYVRPNAASASRFTQLILPRETMPIQKAALTALSAATEDTIATSVLERWRFLSPGVRTEVLEVLLGKPGWTAALVAAIEANQLPPGQMPAAARQRLLKSRDPGLRERALKLFSHADNNRQRVVREYKVNQPGDAIRGAGLFRQHCATCHKFKGEGVALGPDLETLTDKSVDTLLLAILDPNQSVETPFINYTVITRDGRELSGVIASESGSGITLRTAGGTEHAFSHSEIEEMTSSGVSLMPEGLEQGLTPEQMNDLVYYLLTD